MFGISIMLISHSDSASLQTAKKIRMELLQISINALKR